MTKEYKNWWEVVNDSYIKPEYKDSYMMVTCPATGRKYPVEFIKDYDDRKNLRCPACGRYIFRRKKAGRPSIYTDEEKRILKKCSHHPFVYQILKAEVFKFGIDAVSLVLHHYSNLANSTPQHSEERREIVTLCKYIREYIRFLRERDKPQFTTGYVLEADKEYQTKTDYNEGIEKAGKEGNNGDYSDVPGLFDD